MEFTAVFGPVPESSIAFVEELPGANTQGATLAEARANIEEAVRLVLEVDCALSQEGVLGADVIREPFEPSRRDRYVGVLSALPDARVVWVVSRRVRFDRAAAVMTAWRDRIESRRSRR